MVGKLAGDAANKAFVPTFHFENSDGQPLAANAVLSQGDQIKVVAPNYITTYYYVTLHKSSVNTVARATSTSANVLGVAGSVITLAWDTPVANVLPQLVATDKSAQTLTLQYNDSKTATANWVTYDATKHPTVFYNQGDDNNVAKFRLQVKAQDGTVNPTPYTFTLDLSTSKAIQVKSGMAYLVKALDTTNKTITVQFGSTAEQVKLALEAIDKSVPTMVVKNSEGTDKETQLFNNDKLHVTAAKGGTADVYTVVIATVEATPTIQIKSTAKVLNSSLQVQPWKVPGSSSTGSSRC